MQIPEIGRGAYPEKPLLAVGAVVFKDDQVLLVRRANPPARDEWAIPGGRVRLGETLAGAAEREIREETGLRIRAGRPVFTFDYIERDPWGRVRFHYLIVDLEAEYLDGRLRAADDAADARWFHSDELNKISVSSTTRRLLKEVYDF